MSYSPESMDGGVLNCFARSARIALRKPLSSSLARSQVILRSVGR
jgi:hypothetical protein